MLTIAEIRKQIVAALEAGEDTSKLETQLRQARLAERTQVEVAELAQIASKRREYRAQVSTIVSKCKRQGEALDAFLKERDGLLKPLLELMERVKKLQALQEACFAEYSRDNNFWADTRQVPKNYLPEGLRMPSLAHNGGVPYQEIIAWTLKFLQDAAEVLSKAVKLEIQPMPGDLEKTDEGL